MVTGIHWHYENGFNLLRDSIEQRQEPMETPAGIHVESNEGKQVQESSPILVSNGLQVAKYEKINNLEIGGILLRGRTSLL